MYKYNHICYNLFIYYIIIIYIYTHVIKKNNDLIANSWEILLGVSATIRQSCDAARFGCRCSRCWLGSRRIPPTPTRSLRQPLDGRCVGEKGNGLVVCKGQWVLVEWLNFGTLYKGNGLVVYKGQWAMV